MFGAKVLYMLRAVVLAVGFVETVALALFAAILLGSSDPWGIGRAMVALMAAPYVLLTLPGMVLALVDRWVPLALLLVATAMPVAFALWSYA
jgi:hypothetical protein